MKTNCPVCNESFSLKKQKEGKVILCPECDASLYIAKILKNETKIMPFVINTQLNSRNTNSKTDKNQPQNTEFDFDNEYEDDFEEDSFDFDAE